MALAIILFKEETTYNHRVYQGFRPVMHNSDLTRAKKNLKTILRAKIDECMYEICFNIQ